MIFIKNKKMIKSFIFLIFGSLFIGAIVTPPIYSCIQMIFGKNIYPYSRVLDRALMVIVLIFLLCLRKFFSFNDVFKKLKEDSTREAIKKFFISIFISLGVSAFLVFFIDMQQEFVWVKKDMSYYVPKILKTVIGAILISFLEESFFRVILLNFFRKKFNIVLTIFFSSLCYSSVHFIVPDKTFVYSSWSLTVGFEYYVDVIRTMFFPGFFKAFFGLFLVGTVLCIIMQKFSSIYINIGIHSGWVIAMKLFIYSTGEAPNVVMHKMARRYFLVSEPVGWFSIGLVLLLTIIFFSYSKNYLIKKN